MLRASSLGLRLPLPVLCGHHPCFLLRRTTFLPGVVSTFRLYSHSAHVLERNDGKQDNKAKMTSSQQPFPAPAHSGHTFRAEEQDMREYVPRRPFDPFLTSHGQHRFRPPSFASSRMQLLGLRKRIGRDVHKKPEGRKISLNRRQKAGLARETPSTMVKSTRVNSYPTSSPRLQLSDGEVERRALLDTIATSRSAVDSWAAYSQLLQLPHPEQQLGVPLYTMHRLCQILASHRPRTRTLFLQLHSVLVAIRQGGGKITLREWNALIDCAGKGLRRTTAADYENSFSYFQDMTLGLIPGTTLARRTDGKVVDDEECHTNPVKPDIYTYTTLLNIAARTRDSRSFRHASSLLESSGLRPNRITHLALIKYFAATNQLAGVRSTLLKMEHQNLNVGIDGINALLMAYAHNHRLDVVRMIYRLLRHNVLPESGANGEEMARLSRQLQREELVLVPLGMVPDETTYTTIIQIMSYHGDLEATLSAFVDMISTPNTDKCGRSSARDGREEEPPPYQATFAVFRAVFLGFSRHGVHIPLKRCAPELHACPPLSEGDLPQQPGWTLTYLETMFNAFIDMSDSQANRSAAYWIMVAFKKASGNDKDLLRRVLTRMEERFPGLVGGGENRLRRMKVELFRRDGKGGYL